MSLSNMDEDQAALLLNFATRYLDLAREHDSHRNYEQFQLLDEIDYLLTEYTEPLAEYRNEQVVIQRAVDEQARKRKQGQAQG